MVSVQGAAVPAVMAELMLAFSNPLFSPTPNRLHDVWILLTQLSLFIHQPGNIVANHTGTKGSNIPEIHKERGLKPELLQSVTDFANWYESAESVNIQWLCTAWRQRVWSFPESYHSLVEFQMKVWQTGICHKQTLTNQLLFMIYVKAHA